MKQPEEEPIFYKVQLLEELIERQNETLALANEIIDNKGKLIELCEMQVNLYKEENKQLRKALIICFVGLVLTATLSLIRLFA